jgi:ribosomal-protein-alanine N-acetyltransferase
MLSAIRGSNIFIVPMNVEHLDDIVEIDNDYSTKPWSRELFINELNNRFSYNFTILHQNDIAGFINFWHICDLIELNNFAIKYNYRNRGLGRKFLKFIIKLADFLKTKKIFLEVKSDNIIAYNLYKSEGFMEIGVRKGYYSDGRDAILMERLI